MNARDLRIGNYIKIEGLNKPIPVSIIDTTETSEQTTCKPIEITEEWLLKFRFEKIEGKVDIFDKDRLRVWLGDSGQSLAYLIEEDTTIAHYIPNRFKYVHQLQNLYYALTGKELKLNT
jgi:hypothetical protein